MRRHSVRRPLLGASALVALTALATTLVAPSAAAAQVTSGSPSGTETAAPPPDICIQIYPPPAGCPHSQPPPAPDVCIQVYPPPAGCSGRQPWPGQPPAIAPGGTPGVWPAPVARLIPAQSTYRPGDAIFVTVRGADGSVVPALAGYRCEDVWFEVLGPGGWVPALQRATACPAVAVAPQGGPWPVASVPLGQPPGTYRLALRLVDPVGVPRIVHGDPFVVR